MVASARRRPFAAILIGSALSLCAAVVYLAGAAAPGGAAGPSAVLFIGDGMGPAQVTLARVAHGGSAGRLRMDALPYTALSRTHSADSPVTDSAAAASAMACGGKTVNGVLCEDHTAVYAKQDGVKLEPIAVWAKKRGLSVGIVTTTTVTHATPAAFYARHKDRDAEGEIAVQAIDSGFDLILGGGRKFFPADLRTRGASAGWTFVETSADLAAIRGSSSKRILGLFAPGYIPYQPEIDQARAGSSRAGDTRDPAYVEAAQTTPTLPEMVRFALDRLTATGRPFFLMVEGGRIDHACHANWARTAVDETLAFDQAIGDTVDRLDPKRTLVLVTADHETGGLALNGYPEEKEGVWSTSWRDAFMEKDEPSYSTVTFASGPGTALQSQPPPHGADDPRPSGIPLQSAAHTGVDVALYAWGAGAEKVHGTIENTEIYSILKRHLEGTTPAAR